MTASSQLAATTLSAPSVPAAPASARKASGTAAVQSHSGSRSTDELREQFTQFVGETFFGQMIKAMRATVGKPAYFHGGRAEEVFQGQLDQKLAEHLTRASADKFAEPMFERQFPHLTQRTATEPLHPLDALRRV